MAKEAGDAINALRALLPPKQVAPSHTSPINRVREPEMTENAEKSADAMLRDLRLMNQRIAEVTSVLPEGSRQRFTQQATGYLRERSQSASTSNGRWKQRRMCRMEHRLQLDHPRAIKLKRIPDPKIPIDTLAELRRQQTEMLERLAQERGQSRDRERGHEAGD